NLDKAQALAAAEINQKVLQRVWPDPLPQDYFAGRDWYVEGSNVWIVQVGGSDDFGDFQTFKDLVTKARVHMDDVGGFSCSYDIPRPGQTSDRLSLDYSGGGSFSLNGSPFQTDLYPRFENPFLRGGRVEWGQREYVIEYNGKSLLHDFSDFANPLRVEEPGAQPDEASLVKALVIFLKTEDDNMDGFTVATANVVIGCDSVTTDQVIAAGPIDENTYHDAEWIFFDFAAARAPDMTIRITHPASSHGDDTPHWKMSFQLFALMGDRIVRLCTLAGTFFEFVDQNRTSPLFPFSIRLSAWRPWAPISDNKSPVFWMIGCQQSYSQAYYDYTDLLAVDIDRKLWHKRLKTCGEQGWSLAVRGVAGVLEPDVTGIFFAAAVAPRPGLLYLAVQSQGILFANGPLSSGEWPEWQQIDVWVYPDSIFGIPDLAGSPIAITLSAFSPVAGIPYEPANAVELTVLAGDGHFYSRITQQPGDTGAWRKIEVSGFSALSGFEFTVIGDYLLTLAADRSLWATVVDHSANHLFAVWEKLTPPGFAVDQFAVADLQGFCQIVFTTGTGDVRAGDWKRGAPVAWSVIDMPDTTAATGTPLASSAWSDTQAKFFAIGANSKIFFADYDSGTGWAAASWSEVAADSGIEIAADGALAALSRVSGQVEVYAQSKDGALWKAWWS
ncbi:MAG: hypothetical protein JO061_17600, partial [Acidobacteriaceae bacterium]|nr:hypothetical protein [Acidobacteriaceae bacterium]